MHGKRPGSNANSPIPSEPLEAPLEHPDNIDGKKRPKRFKKAVTKPPETRSMLPEGLFVQKAAAVSQVDGAAYCSDSEGSTNPLPKLDEKEEYIKTVKAIFKKVNKKELEESPSAGIVRLASKVAA